MTGVVLCGGNSTRMGSDKGLLKEEEETWSELATRKLKALGMPVYISINSQQYSAYEQIFPLEKLLVDDDRFEAKAPLFGLLSVHLRMPQEDLFVLACDIKDITPLLLEDLLASSQEESYDVVVYRTREKPQPLCGSYRARGLQTIYKLFSEGQLKRYSMMHVLELLNTKLIAVAETDLPLFANYNNPEEL